MSNNARERLFSLFGNHQDKLSNWLDKTLERAATSQHLPASNPIVLPSTLQSHEHTAELTQLCNATTDAGHALYTWSDSPTDIPAAVSRLLNALGLYSADDGVITESAGLSLLQDATGTRKGRFPPYQPKAMNWHTDGYYNAPADRVRCFTLHCVEPAAEGGALLLMDDAFLILTLLSEDQDAFDLLCHPQAMTLPHNRDEQGHDRPDRSVPMIQQNNDGSLSTRFTTRSQNIHWRCDETQAAATRAVEIINEYTQWHSRVMLQRGQGILTRNVLHAREAFVDAPGQPKRQMLRGRFNVLPTPTQPTETDRSNKEHSHVAR